MPRNRTLITVASWEHRFIRGFEWALNEYDPASVQMYFFDSYADWTRENRERAQELCDARDAKLQATELAAGDTPGNWRGLRDHVAALPGTLEDAIVQITTMPRDLIWSTFWLLECQEIPVKFFYHQPEAYDEQWLSRDPGRPRLVYKLSGIARLGEKTTLLLLAGYDVERTNQIVQFFEPSLTLIGIQRSGGDPQNESHMEHHRKRFDGMPRVTLFDIDAYAKDHGEGAIVEQLAKSEVGGNVLMSSLGPKLSAVSLYRVQKARPESALAYAPSREFNKDYSRGMGAVYCGDL